MPLDLGEIRATLGLRTAQFETAAKSAEAKVDNLTKVGRHAALAMTALDRGFNLLERSLGTLSPELAKTSNAIGLIAQGLATGGPYGAALAAGVAAVNALTDAWVGHRAASVAALESVQDAAMRAAEKAAAIAEKIVAARKEIEALYGKALGAKPDMAAALAEQDRLYAKLQEALEGGSSGQDERAQLNRHYELVETLRARQKLEDDLAALEDARIKKAEREAAAAREILEIEEAIAEVRKKAVPVDISDRYSSQLVEQERQALRNAEDFARLQRQLAQDYGTDISWPGAKAAPPGQRAASTDAAWSRAAGVFSASGSVSGFGGVVGGVLGSLAGPGPGTMIGSIVGEQLGGAATSAANALMALVERTKSYARLQEMIGAATQPLVNALEPVAQSLYPLADAFGLLLKTMAPYVKDVAPALGAVMVPVIGAFNALTATILTIKLAFLGLEYQIKKSTGASDEELKKIKKRIKSVKEDRAEALDNVMGDYVESLIAAQNAQHEAANSTSEFGSAVAAATREVYNLPAWFRLQQAEWQQTSPMLAQQTAVVTVQSLTIETDDAENFWSKVMRGATERGRRQSGGNSTLSNHWGPRG